MEEVNTAIVYCAEGIEAPGLHTERLQPCPCTSPPSAGYPLAFSPYRNRIKETSFTIQITFSFRGVNNYFL